MSTILKALQRLEEEKAAAAPRGLREELAAPRPSRSRARRWLPGLAFVALLALGIGWWGWPRAAVAPLPPPVAKQSPAPAPAPVLRPKTTAGRSAEPEQAVVPEAPRLPGRGMPEQAFSSPVEVVARPAAKPRIPLEEPAAPTRETPQAVAEAPPIEAAVAVAPAPVRTLEANAPKPAPRPAAVASTATPAPPTPRAPAPEPAPDSVAELAPPLRVEKTLWHPRPQRREALVAIGDGAVTRIHEGELIAGVRVAEIRPSGVVFERAGETIHRRVGEP